MNIKDLTKIYTENTLDVARHILRANVGLEDVVTTPLDDKVTISTRSRLGSFGLRVWDTIITGGPHHHTEELSTTAEDALRVHWSWIYRHETGRYGCTKCDGNGQIEHFVDRVVWGSGGIAGHTTDHWTEDCDQCDEDGLAMDEDVTGTYIENGAVVE